MLVLFGSSISDSYTNKQKPVVQKIEEGVQCIVCVVWPGLEALAHSLVASAPSVQRLPNAVQWNQAPKRGGGGDGSTVAKWYRAHDLLFLLLLPTKMTSRVYYQ